MRALAFTLLALLLSGAAATVAVAGSSAPGSSGPEARAAARWCDTARVRYGRGWGWPQGSEDLSCRQIVDRGRALVLRNVRPRGWRCSIWRARNGQRFGDCVRGKSFYGVGEPH